ncbi:phage/plasmid primase, P4 family (plasmid) [Gemmatirosa kalamazoonensis]|uniref:Phage/plasmid primase, P4 family n=1 Tax=Gemmatirosa kalamazoonensis TaxID=861299 RepID=W0RME9_9BACT|nr:phage/plasmid primase, P4 family [Gemmatirosa kalamazoonensis]AHG92147.1 phage/plasmid primase, P4 family [Gemmatirosa kalamazoonensis]AHG92214.1 phage/plasmid primase, P4 family [Gemmatirosa kalamazoonensis]
MNAVAVLSDVATFNPTDLGNAERLVARHGADLHYVPAWKRWLVWDGRRWAVDDTQRIHQLAKETVRAILEEARDAATRDEAELLAKHAIASESNGRIGAMIERAQCEEGIPARPTDFDADPDLLTLANGTLDLRTGRLRPHAREDRITKLVDIRLEADARCPTWLAFLERIMGGDQDMIGFLQRAIGYSLTGHTREQCMFLMHGTGSNGKSKFLQVLRWLVGDAAVAADFATFLDRGRDSGPRNDVARLLGARVVTASEANEGQRLAEGLIKSVTGDDVVSARYLYSEAFEFKPTFKLWLAANHKPVVRGTDDGIWRRVRLVPFEVTIPPEEQDHELDAKLQGELPGILGWALDGCLAWRRGRLQPPERVLLATASYRAESDVLGAWIAECCVREDGAADAASSLYASYKKWAENGGEYVMSQTLFGRRLEERGITKELRGTGAQRLVWRRGVRLASQDAPAARWEPAP